MLPITTGAIPFGAVVGTVYAEAQFSFFQSFGSTLFIYAGAAQLAAVELMNQNAASVVVVCTGLIINLRFLLYSAAISPVVQNSSALTKLACAYGLTDQSYAVISANQDKLKTNSDTIEFYFGASVCMMLAWYLSFIGGYVFGNFAPTTWALEYAVPLSFVALVIPTLKNRIYVAVAVFSSVVSLLLNDLPYKTGLIATALMAIAFGALLSKKGKQK